MKGPKAIAASTLLMFMGQSVPAASPPVGLIVYAEQWDPAMPNSETLKVLENNPTLLSDALNSAWGVFRTWYLANVPSMLHTPNYLYTVSNHAVPTGITLYSRMGNTNLPPEMTLPTQVDFTLVPEGTNMFRADFRVPGSTISLCSTTPSLARPEDPCIDLSADIIFSLSLQISDVPNQLLNVTAASVSFSNFQYSKGNWVTDVALVVSDVVNFFGGPDYTALIVRTIDNTSVPVKTTIQNKAIAPLDATLGRYEQTALTAINQQLQPGVSVSRLIHLAVWAQNQPNSKTLNLLFAPPLNGISVDPAHETGHFSGTLTFDNSVKTIPACSALNTSPQFTGQVQTGPRPVININGGNPVFGAAPMQGLSVAFSGGDLQGRQCPYTLSHLAIGLPNILNFSNFVHRTTGNASISSDLAIQPSRWASPVVLASNGTVIYAGSASQPQAMAVLPSNAAQFAATVAHAPAPPPPPPGPPRAASPIATAPIAAQGWNTAASSNVQKASVRSLDLVASIQLSVQRGVGALPKQATIGTVAPGDPMATQAQTPAWGTAPQAAKAAPVWTPVAPAAAPGAIGTSLQRGTLNVVTPLKTLQPAAPAAPSSLQH